MIIIIFFFLSLCNCVQVCCGQPSKCAGNGRVSGVAGGLSEGHLPGGQAVSTAP